MMRRYMTHTVIKEQDKKREKLTGLWIVEVDSSSDSLSDYPLNPQYEISSYNVRVFDREEPGVEFVDAAIIISSQKGKKTILSFESV